MSWPTVETLGTRLRDARAQPLEALASPITWVVLATVLATAALALDRAQPAEGLPASFAEFYAAGQSAFATEVDDDPVRAWSFSKGAPKTWTSIGRVFAPPRGSAASVRTGSQPSGYQLASPVTTLEPGTYQIAVHGRVDRGGISIGALDPERESFLAASNYWSGQPRAGGVMATAFKLDRPTAVRVMLSNWAPEPSTSRWTISRVTIGPLPAGRTIPRAREVQPDYLPVYQAGAAPHLPDVGGSAVAQWDFALQLPSGWRVIQAPRITNRSGSLEVLTTQSIGDYQLVGPPLSLPRGRYVALLDGKVVKGGIQLGVLDAGGDRWLATANAWSGEQPAENERIGVPFTVREPIDVAVVLSNWAPEPNASSWSLKAVRIVADRRPPVASQPARTPTAAEKRLFAGQETQRSSQTAAVGARVASWRFAAGVPAPWALLPEATLTAFADGLVLHTSTSPFQDQLSLGGVALQPGSYVVAIDGRVLRGGLDVRVAAAGVDGHVGRAFFSSAGVGDGKLMVVPVQVDRAATVTISLANRVPVPSSSAWSLRRISLLRAP